MAFIKTFEKQEPIRSNLHPTQVKCRYFILEKDGKKIVQLNTYGSAEREMPEKLSQTLQLDRDGAETLIRILKREFGLR